MLGLVVVMEAERSAVGLSSLLPLFGSAAGWPLVLEGIAVLVAGVALVVVELWPAPRTIAILGAAAAAAMFLHAYAGHAAGPSPARALNLFEQWLHLLAFGVWIGGLAWLLYGARGQPHNQTAAAVRRFSLLAGYALAAVAVTGGLRAISEVGAARNLLVTPFGLVLLVKVGIFLGLALLGAVNHYRSVPALLRGVRSRFVWNSRAELLLAVSVVGLAGYLGGLSPANQAAAAGASPPNQLVVSGADYGLTVRVRLTITPGVVGANEFTVQVTDYASGQPTPARGVQLLFTLPAKPSVGASSLTLKQAAAGTWKGRGLELSIAGDWTCQVLVQEAANAVVVPLTIHAALP
jgi:putative copper export protein